MGSLIKVVLSFLMGLNVGLSSKILGIFPVPAPSHRNLYSPLMKELVQRGHDVTVISPYEDDITSKSGSYKSIVLSGLSEWMQDSFKQSNPFESTERSIFQNIKFSVRLLDIVAEKTLASKNVQELIKSDEKFDIIIMTEVLNSAHKALAPHFNASLILFSTVGANSWVNQLVGNPAPPSYVPDLFSSYCEQMTFTERLLNSLVFVYNQLYLHHYSYPKHKELIKKYISSGYDLEKVIHNVSLVLLNSHPSINQPVPYVPNMIDIGGFHIKPPKKLPQDLQEYLDNAPNGVIYFSMGSNLKSSNLPLEKRKAFLKTFSQLKQNILWKWEDDVLPDKPENVKLSKWLPQQDLLAHPNIKLFITHGGLLSTTETVYHGVPVLAIPIFGDQKINAKIAVNHGFGLSLAFNDVTQVALTQAIEEILDNPKYANNAKMRSKLFHDRLKNPMDTAIFWIEYVIRHKGAPHLRVAGLELAWYKYLLLDVIVFIALSFLFMLTIVFWCFKIICCKKKYNSGNKTKTS